MSSLKYWIWLATRSGINVRSAAELADYFGSADAVFFAEEGELGRLPGLTEAGRRSLADKDLDRAERIMERCGAEGYRILTFADAEYPERLRNIPDPPMVLYAAGRLPAFDEEAAIAVVGTRRCTPYGVKAAETISYEIAKAGGLIVSGLALGIDSAAVKGALRAGARAVGVIGSGLDVVYPRENAGLFREVAANGAVISEYPPGTEPAKQNFPARNRLLAGLSVGVVVVEAPLRSGALITASRALEDGRDVFAVPGNIDAPTFEGSNALLREGASAALSGYDVALEYAALFPGKINLPQPANMTPPGPENAQKFAKSPLSIDKMSGDVTKKEIDNADGMAYIDVVTQSEDITESERRILGNLREGAASTDELVVRTGLPASEVLSALTFLEIKGLVARQAGNMYSIDFARK